MSFGERLKQLREEHEKSREDLAKILNVSYSAVSKYETDNRIPNNTILRKIAEYFGVTTDYLIGKTTSPTLDLVNILEDTKSQLIAAGRPLTQQQRLNLIRALDQDKPAGPSKQIPIVATIRAGVPILTEEHIAGHLEIPADVRADFAVKLRGDSMIWAGLHEGDYALCREAESAHTGQMVVAAVQDVEWGGTIKYFIQANGKKILRAANPAYEDITMGPEDRIVGAVIAVMKKTPPGLHTYEGLVSAVTGRGHDWASLAVTAANIGWSPRDIEEMVKLMAKVPRQVREPT